MTRTDQPMLRLAPVPLPAPDGPPDEPRSLAARALLSIALLGGVFVIAGLVVAALVGLNLAAFAAGRVVPYLVVITIVVVVALVRAAIAAVRRPSDPPDEVEIPAAAEPELHAAVRDVAAVAGTRPPDRIVVVNDVNAYVNEFGPMLGLVAGRRTLAIGAPLLDGLDVTQLRSVLAHELGHLAGGDTRLGPLTYRTDTVLVRVVTSLGGGVVARIFAAYWRFQHKVNASVRRNQEVVADSASVRVAGRQATADALFAVEVLARADHVVTSTFLVPMLRAGYRPDDIPSGLRSFLAHPGTPEGIARDAWDDPDPGDPLAFHPPTRERIRRVAAVAECGPVTHDHRAARVLLRHPDHWAAAAADASLAVALEGATLQPAPWSAYGEIVAAPEQGARAADVEATLSRLGLPAGIEGIRTAMTSGRGRELAGALVSSGWRTGADDERTVLVRSAIVATATQQAMSSGTYAWSGDLQTDPVLRRRDGTTVALGPLATDAVAGRWEPLWEIVGAAAPAPPTGPPATSPTTSHAAQIPVPPQPPFVASSGGYLWEAHLPARAGRSATIHVGEAGLALDGAVIGYDEIAHVETKLVAQTATVGSNMAATGSYRITRPDGVSVSLTTKGSKRETSQAVMAAVLYTWDLLGATAGVRIRAAIVGQVAQGQSVTVAELLLTPEGVSLAKKPKRFQSWAGVRDPVLSQLQVVVPGTEQAFQVGMATRDAYLLPALLPELRAHFS